jgi:hypothetical protein
MSAGDLECRDVKLLLLERRPVSRKGNRSFIEGDLGVSNTERNVDAWSLDVESGCCLFDSEVLLESVVLLICATGVWLPSRVPVGDIDFSTVGILALVLSSPRCLCPRGSSTCDSVVFPVVSAPARGVVTSRDSRRTTVVSSCSVCDVRIESDLFFLDGVVY